MEGAEAGRFWTPTIPAGFGVGAEESAVEGAAASVESGLGEGGTSAELEAWGGGIGVGEAGVVIEIPGLVAAARIAS